MYRNKFNEDATLEERINHIDELECRDEFKLKESITIKDAHMTSQLYFSKLCGDVSGEDMELEREVSRADEVLGMSLTDGHFSEGELYFSNVRGAAGQPTNY